MRMHGQGLNKPFKNLIFKSRPVPHFRFPVLSQCAGVYHFIFTRHGGLSEGNYAQLNVSSNVGDDPQKVAANLTKIRDTIGARCLVSMTQVHGDNIVLLHKGDVVKDTVLGRCDGVVTDAPGVAVMVKLADCQGVIVFSEERGVLGISHCGWRGNVLNILGKLVGVMEKEFACSAKELRAAIGPSLGPCCGEFKEYREIFPPAFSRYMVRENYFDLWAISCHQLMDAGIRAENIETAEICTKCNEDLFFSYRANKVTGRFATVAMLIGEA